MQSFSLRRRRKRGGLHMRKGESTRSGVQRMPKNAARLWIKARKACQFCCFENSKNGKLSTDNVDGALSRYIGTN